MSRKQTTDVASWSDVDMVDHAIATAIEYGRNKAPASDVANGRDLLFARLKELRVRLLGRTMHCGMCETYAKQRDDAIAAIVQFIDLDKGQQGRKWLSAWLRLQEIADGSKGGRP